MAILYSRKLAATNPDDHRDVWVFAHDDGSISLTYSGDGIHGSVMIQGAQAAELLEALAVASNAIRERA